MTVFGQIIGQDEVEDAVEATLKLWLPTYLAEMERLSGRDQGVLPMPNSWSKVNAFTQDQRDQLPAAYIVSPGTFGDISRRGDGAYDVWFEISVGVLVTSTSREGANTLAKLYAKAVLALMLQQRSLGGFAQGMVWLSQRNDLVPADYLAIGWITENVFAVWVQGVVTDQEGPSTPDLDPADRPAVASAHIATERIPV